MRNRWTAFILAAAVGISSILPGIPAAAATKSVSDFQDVKEGQYFYEPVKWALENDVTSGKSDDAFAPGEDCTREQFMTFIYKAAKGSPVSADQAFLDVSSSDYFYDPVQWAVSRGITAGEKADIFGAGHNCTRAQAVTFLWKLAGKPTNLPVSHFSDVPADSWYADAVDFAVYNKITSGTGNGEFSPQRVCSRAEAVTFLYNYYNQTADYKGIELVPYLGKVYDAETESILTKSAQNIGTGSDNEVRKILADGVVNKDNKIYSIESTQNADTFEGIHPMARLSDAVATLRALGYRNKYLDGSINEEEVHVYGYNAGPVYTDDTDAEQFEGCYYVVGADDKDAGGKKYEMKGLWFYFDKDDTEIALFVPATNVDGNTTETSGVIFKISAYSISFQNQLQEYLKNQEG